MLRLIAALNFIPLTLISIIPKDPHENWNLKESNWRNFIPRIPREFWGIYPVRLILTLPGALSGGILGIYYLKYLGGSPESWSIVVALTTLLGLTTIPYGKLADKLPIKKNVYICRFRMDNTISWILYFTNTNNICNILHNTNMASILDYI